MPSYVIRINTHNSIGHERHSRVVAVDAPCACEAERMVTLGADEWICDVARVVADERTLWKARSRQPNKIALDHF